MEISYTETENRFGLSNLIADKLTLTQLIDHGLPFAVFEMIAQLTPLSKND